MGAGCIAALLVFVSKARSQTLDPSGTQLYKFCVTKPAEDPLGGGSGMFCLGYLTSMRNVMASGSPLAGQRACIPAKADGNQIVDVVTNYIRSHPDTRHLPAYVLVSRAFSASFPCR